MRDQPWGLVPCRRACWRKLLRKQRAFYSASLSVFIERGFFLLLFFVNYSLSVILFFMLFIIILLSHSWEKSPSFVLMSCIRNLFYFPIEQTFSILKLRFQQSTSPGEHKICFVFPPCSGLLNVGGVVYKIFGCNPFIIPVFGKQKGKLVLTLESKHLRVGEILH